MELEGESSPICVHDKEGVNHPAYPTAYLWSKCKRYVVPMTGSTGHVSGSYWLLKEQVWSLYASS